MVLCNEVTRWMKDDITQPPTEGVYVYGLYLEGAGWDRRSCKLVDSKPKVLFEMMPVIRMYAENNGEVSCLRYITLIRQCKRLKGWFRLFNVGLYVILTDCQCISYSRC